MPRVLHQAAHVGAPVTNGRETVAVVALGMRDVQTGVDELADPFRQVADGHGIVPAHVDDQPARGRGLQQAPDVFGRVHGVEEGAAGRIADDVLVDLRRRCLGRGEIGLRVRDE